MKRGTELACAAVMMIWVAVLMLPKKTLTDIRIDRIKHEIPISYFSIEFYGIQTNISNEVRLMYPATKKNMYGADKLDMRYVVCDNIPQAKEIRNELMIFAREQWDKHLSEEWKQVEE